MIKGSKDSNRLGLIIFIVFVQYLFTFSFPVLCIVLPFVLSCVFYNLWFGLIYLVSIPAVLTQRVAINMYKNKGKEFHDFWRFLSNLY